MTRILQRPKFYANPDNSHCVQACLRSVLSVVLPGHEFSWKKLEEMTDYLPGHGAWVYAELLSLKDYGIEARLLTNFNPRRFIEHDFKYIAEEYGQEVADYEKSHPHDYNKLKRQMQRSLDNDLVIQQQNTFKDIKKRIDDGWYVMIQVNSKALNDKKGYAGHRILAYDYTGRGVIAHDPGSSQHHHESRHIDWSQLGKSWENSKDLIVVKSS